MKQFTSSPIVLLILIKTFILCVCADLDLLDSEVENECIHHCPIQNSTDLEHYDYSCDDQCNTVQCSRGCRLWKEALSSSCPKVCNGFSNRIKAKDLYCVIGCNNAISKYFSHLSARLGTPPPPALVADSLNSTSLKLEWNFPPGRKPGLACYIQWQYEKRSETWQNCPNVTWNPEETIAFVDNLQPYTKYRFRVALIPIHHGEPILSSSSVVISTLPSGVPESSPIIEIPPEVNHYVFRNLAPKTNYNVSIRMRNSVGLGPATQVTISTPSEPLVRGSKKPILILGTEHSVIEQGTYILDEPVVLYETEKSIKGLAVHINKKLLFVSESDGHVAKMSLESKKSSYILNPEQINFKPLDLSVDWLNNQLYILGEVGYENKMWQIARCNLDGSGLTVAIAGLMVKPYCVEVDPYNGYLFWVLTGHNKGGLYRLDLADISNGIRHEVRPEIILKDPYLGAFNLDHTNFSLLVARQKENTINSVSLDGKEIYNMRPKVIKSKMHKVVSLATANKIFYWTDGDNVFYEEHRDAYYHNSYPDLSARTYNKVIVNLESSQPIPIPVNPPRNLQAMFGENFAKTNWRSPHLLDGQGRGAWQNWSYELSFRNILSNELTTIKGINSTFCTIHNLTSNSKYIVKAAAFTAYGRGPWSREFIGATLLNKKKEPFIFWAGSEGILMSDPTGQNIKTIIHSNGMKNFFITDMAWFHDQVYLVTNNSQMLWYNTTSRRRGKLLDSVGSIGIDWVGKKLYWSNPKQQMMIRGNLNGTQQEPLSISAVAKEIEIDSVKAYIYWSTGYAVECAHLNGADKIDYRKAKFFSGKQVMGLTLDMDHKNLYWIVGGSEGSILFKAQMAGYIDAKHINVEEIANLNNPLEGPLSYFHNRLLWLQDDETAAMSDLLGQNTATIKEVTLIGLTTVYVVDPTLHTLPEKDELKVEEIIVIPNIVNRNSVKVIGSSESFNVSWDPVDNVNYGTVFYEVQIDPLSRNDSTIITTYPSIKYWQIVTPYTKLHVSIRAFTYWGASQELKVKIFSPPSTPSAPKNVRSYVEHQQNVSNDENQVTITFRWDIPMYPNGIIQGYKVFCWYYQNDVKLDICKKIIKRPDQMEHIVENLNDTSGIYYFEVRAFTKIGDGKMSETLYVDSKNETPLPKLLIASTDSIYLQDVDANQNHSIVHGINSPLEMGYLIKEKKIFWINELSELYMYTMLNSNKTKLYDVLGDVGSLTIDWLERSLYYVEKDDENSIIFKINLNLYEQNVGIIHPIEILRRPYDIIKLEASPFTKKLYWIEINDETRNLMECSLNGDNIMHFFSKNQRNKREINENDYCNCPLNPLIESFSLDHSNMIQSKPILTFVDNESKNILTSDKDGCRCEIIANNSIIGNYFPVKKIKSDFGSLYWTNDDNLYVLKRQKKSIIAKELKIQDISIFGHHIQPYPPKYCLEPYRNENIQPVVLRQRKSSSLHLILPNYEIHQNCTEFSLATVEYTVCYSEINEHCDGCLGKDCKIHTSFDKEIFIENLKPFTKYRIWNSYGNYFSKQHGKIDGPVTILQTAPGAPSKPLDVTATVLNPTLAEVTWKTPMELNGEIVYYEIHWQTEGARSGVRKKEEQPVLEHQTLDEKDKTFKSFLHKLSPNETYTVWVRAYCETNATSRDSDRVKIVTYPIPSSINLLNKTSHTMHLSWNISPYVKQAKAQYSSLMSNEWNDVTHQEKNKDIIYFFVEHLHPKHFYRFRLSLIYEKYPKEFFWPLDSKFTFETLGDRPSPPGIPIIQYLNPNEYRVWWEAAKNNGAPIELYKLEGLLLKHYRTRRSTSNRTAYFYTAPSIIEEEPQWKTFYNGTNTSWIIDGLSEEYKYVFRVFAKNSFGWSDPSKESIEFDLNETARLADKQSAMTVVVIATGITISFIFVVIIVLISLLCSGKKKETQIIHIQRAPDVELATLRELPRRGVHNTNVLYVSTLPTPEEIKLLPHIKREQITLTKFLGKGAFGEVYEGKAKEIQGHTRVAIKTLRKEASDQEKSEFLQEAQLMSHFKHEHILELLGVCLDNDPHFIIMELMEGGDLLTYLRSSRNQVAESPPPLTLIELLKMCVDVSKGCRYLEEMHFVHRDLACRNCLVSTSDPENRIVKIGDFGLARDVYKNDYYRKEGEGLLPVRWMAPESLVDGVFTSQSDVWAFGVLLWEIMTLGQQPYPARNNLEVLHYVKRGGRLGKPIDCPVELHSLMLQCWEFVPEKRPTFKYCLEVLQSLHRQKIRNPTTGAHEGQYISTVPEYASWRSDNDDDKEKIPFLTEHENIPKYLELLCDPNSSLENDGYEIPNQMLNHSENEDKTNDS